MSKKLTVVIPARFASSRFPGKPLTDIAGKSMVQRVYEIAKAAIKNIPHSDVIISTEDNRIVEHVKTFGANVMLTKETCRTGSDRALTTCTQLDYTPNIVINLQGDAPLTPPRFIKAIIETLINNQDVDVATPVTQLTWHELDALRERKKTQPFSGTTAICNKDNRALWFSKQIIPAIRNEKSLREQNKMSPVFRHIGIYGYQFKALQSFIRLASGYYENIEALEQLRMLEHGMTIQTVKVNYRNYPSMSGVDTKEDASLASSLIKSHGNPVNA